MSNHEFHGVRGRIDNACPVVGTFCAASLSPRSGWSVTWNGVHVKTKLGQKPQTEISYYSKCFIADPGKDEDKI